MREFPKTGDPNLNGRTVGSLLYGPRNKVPPIIGNSHEDAGRWSCLVEALLSKSPVANANA